jgi:hypothetical protein
MGIAIVKPSCPTNASELQAEGGGFRFIVLSHLSFLGDTPRPVERDGLLSTDWTMTVFPREPHQR